MDKRITKSIFFKDENLPFVEARFVIDSDYHYNEHFHETLSIGAIEKGQTQYKHQDKVYMLEPNQLAVINPYEVHSCNPQKDQSRTYHMTYLDKDWCKEIQINLFGHIDNFILVSKVEIHDKFLFDKYIKLNKLLLDKSAFYLEKEEKLQIFLIELFKKYCDKDFQFKKLETNRTKIVKKAKEYIQKNIKNNISLKDISDELNISSFHLIKIFKTQIYITPHMFLLNEKISEAKKLITNKVNISEVAYDLGFSDQSHFNRVFKKIVATTPNQYKKSIFS